MYTYVFEFFTMDAYRRIYGHAIFSIADISTPMGVKREDLIIKSPITKLKAERSKKKCIKWFKLFVHVYPRGAWLSECMVVDEWFKLFVHVKWGSAAMSQIQ